MFTVSSEKGPKLVKIGLNSREKIISKQKRTVLGTANQPDVIQDSESRP